MKKNNAGYGLPPGVNPPRRKRGILSKIALIVLILATLVTIGAYYYTSDLVNREKLLSQQANDDYFAARQKYATPEPTEGPLELPTHERPMPTIAPEKKVRPEFVELMEKYDNQDIVGYLSIPDTTINYIVVQSSDNEYYLTHDINRAASSAGWVFLDFENDIKKDDYNMIIYGHNMRRDIMFHSLRYFADKSFFEKHKYVIFNSLYEDQIWEIFSFYETFTNFNYIQVVFKNYDSFWNLAQEMKNRSMYNTGVELQPGDRILTLSTCTGYADRDTRFVIEARLVTQPQTLTPPSLIDELNQ
jgi:sortase B